MADALVAGVADFHDLVVKTRNIKHFRALGVAVVTPEQVVQWEECPSS